MSDLAAMAKEVDIVRARVLKWIAEYDFSACDDPNCLHPCCRGKTVEQRRAEGPILELSKLEAPDTSLTR